MRGGGLGCMLGVASVFSSGTSHPKLLAFWKHKWKHKSPSGPKSHLAGLEVFWARRYFGLCCGLVNNLKPFLLSASELMLACSRSFRPSVVSPQESSFLWFEFDGHELVVYHEAVLMYHSRQVWGVWGGLG